MNDVTTRLNDLELFYDQMNRLKDTVEGYRYLNECNGKMDWPERGVYFFFEKGEFRHDSSQLRVVRVGTHAISKGSKSTLWSRLRTHRGSENSKGGNHRGSVFRLLVGSALIKQGDYPPLDGEMWEIRKSVGHEVRRKEGTIEKDVSDHIGSMPFLWVDVNDEPGLNSDRKYIEQNSIALLSNFRGCPDLPSESWIGKYCPRTNIVASGLWNSNHVNEEYDPEFIKVLEKKIDEMEKMNEIKQV